MSHSPELNEELDWLAFQYVAGELSSVDAERFESLLAHDQAAREAIARAVELAQVVGAAESELHCVARALPAEKQSVAWGQRLSWMAIGGVLSLLVAAWSSGMFRWGAADALRGDIGELAAAWFETRQELRAIEETGPLHPLYVASAEEAELLEESGDGSLAIDTPSWMTAAVAGVSEQAGDHSPEDEESGVN